MTPRPWLVTALRGSIRITVGEFSSIPYAMAVLHDQLIESCPKLELNPDFRGPFPMSINVAYTRSGVRGLALRQYNAHSRREEWVSHIFTGPFAFRDAALLRNEIEAELAAGQAEKENIE